MILITAPDDAIGPVAQRLAALARHSLAGKVVLHASGALASGARAAWTGPAARGDRATLRRHFQELRRWPREYRDAYAALLKLQLLLLR